MINPQEHIVNIMSSVYADKSNRELKDKYINDTISEEKTTQELL